MGKPGTLEAFDSNPISIDEYVQHAKEELDAFANNMRYLKAEDRTMFNWFYTLGFWNEALEFRDEFPKYFEEFQ